MSPFGNMSASQSAESENRAPFTYGQEMLNAEQPRETAELRALVPERSELEELLQTVARVAQEKCLPGAAAFGMVPERAVVAPPPGVVAPAAEFQALADLLTTSALPRSQ